MALTIPWDPRLSRGFIKRKRRIGQAVGERLRLPNDRAAHVSDAYVLRDAGDVTLQHGLIVQTWQSLPYSDPDVLHKIVDPVGVAFVDSRDASYHRGMDFDDLLQLDHAAPATAYNGC